MARGCGEEYAERSTAADEARSAVLDSLAGLIGDPFWTALAYRQGSVRS